MSLRILEKRRALLDAGQLSQLVENLGVVEGAGELVAARADGVDVDGGAGVGLLLCDVTWRTSTYPLLPVARRR